jgi:hypothetical protein
MPARPLWRNRDFVLLQSGRLLSSLGTQSTTIAYPLLVLALTHSAARAGLVGFVRGAAQVLFSLPAGLAADHVGRRRLMIAADAGRLVALGGLGAALLAHHLPFLVIPLVAFLEGTGAAFFDAAQAGALRGTVEASQLPAAVGAESGRRAAVQLTGPPVGGVLFGVQRALPFLVDAGSYVLSMVSLLAMRSPFQKEAPAPGAQRLRDRLAEGVGFLWRSPFLRATALIFGLANFIGPGLLLCVVVLGRRQGLSPAVVSGLVAAFGAGLLVGSFLASLLRKLLPVRAIVVLELWAWTGCAAFLIWPNAYVLAASLVPTALAIPATDSVVHGYRIAMTPDRLLGRSESARSLVSLSIAPLGPLAAGLLLEVSGRAAIALFASCALVLAVSGTASRSIRSVPHLDELPAMA